MLSCLLETSAAAFRYRKRKSIRACEARMVSWDAAADTTGHDSIRLCQMAAGWISTFSPLARLRHEVMNEVKCTQPIAAHCSLAVVLEDLPCISYTIQTSSLGRKLKTRFHRGTSNPGVICSIPNSGMVHDSGYLTASTEY